MKQSRLMSWVETCLNTAIGFVVAISAQLVIFPLFGFSPPLSHNLMIGALFTVVSIVRGFVLRRLFEALHIRRPLSPFAAAVIAERARQIEVEGWTAEHDDAHATGEMAMAGACYGMMPALRGKCFGSTVPPEHFANIFWPWAADFWKPQDNRRDLVRAAALLLAEGEKLDRRRKSRPRKIAEAA